AYAQQVNLEARIKDLEAQILAEKQISQEAQTAQQMLVAAREELNDRLAQTLLNLTQTQSELDGSRANVSELKQLLEQVENDSTTTHIALEDRLAAAIENLSAARSERDQIRDQMNALTKNLAATGEDLKNAKDLIATLTEKNRLLESDGASQKQELDDLNNVYGVVQSERDSLRDKLAEAVLNLTKSDTELENARAQSDQLNLDLQALRSTAEQTVGDVETRLADALASLAETQKERAELKSQLAEAILNLTQSKTAAEKLQTALDALASSKDSNAASVEKELARALAELAASETKSDDLQAQLKSAIAAKLAAEALSDTRLDESVEKEILRQEALKKLKESEVALTKSEEEALKLQKQTTALNAQVAELRKQLGQLQALLEESEAADRDNKVQLQNLGNRLNAALAKAAAEERRRRKLEEEERKRLEKELLEKEELANQAMDLAKYKSEFFGRMKDFLGEREGVRIVGDRFVFSSEVLFALGSADLSDEGAAELMKVGQILNEIMSDIPENINWVIRVDGHTDNSPIRNSISFADNWELSQARALSVVRFMISELYIPPARLSANGFGEFQPLNPADTPEARAQNRRIELKLTEK
ncbi:MAG: peptidoglycan -binding protein, partial [Paracoccaceae bacterium]